MTFLFYISGHGFGHAARTVEVIREIRRLTPDARIIVRTMAPRWFLEGSLGASLDVQPVETDTGVVQIDSLRLDEDETARAAASFHAHFDRRADEEAALLRTLGPTVVVGDIPALAFAAAHRAGVPSVAIGNFTWDWIYRGYPCFEAIAPGVIDAIGHAYSHATLALRLPFTGGFDTMEAAARDIPLIARRASHSREAARRAIGLGDGPVVLASFGGHGLSLSYERIAAQNAFTLLITDHEAPEPTGRPQPEAGRSGRPQPADRLRRLTFMELAHGGLKYEDLVSAADVVVTKAGYGIVSECIANDAALLYTPRGRFREHDIFIRDMPRVLRCREISQADLTAGRWQSAIDMVLRQPAPADRPPVHGAEVAADAIVATAAATA